MTKEFNLSEKIIFKETNLFPMGAIEVEDVKEFIRLLIEEIEIHSDADGVLSKTELIEVIKEFTGDKLI